MSEFTYRAEALCFDDKTGLSLKVILKFILDYDFSEILKRLVKVENWNKSSALIAIEQYKHFIFLKRKYPHHEPLPAPTDLDQVWHAHILFTKNYEQFCIKVFGKFLHHNPVNENDPEMQNVMRKGFIRLQALHKREFGTYIFRINKSGFIRKLLLGTGINSHPLTKEETIQ